MLTFFAVFVGSPCSLFDEPVEKKCVLPPLAWADPLLVVVDDIC